MLIGNNNSHDNFYMFYKTKLSKFLTNTEQTNALLSVTRKLFPQAIKLCKSKSNKLELAVN